MPCVSPPFRGEEFLYLPSRGVTVTAEVFNGSILVLTTHRLAIGFGVEAKNGGLPL